MTAIGKTFSEKKKKCRYRTSKIEKDTRTSGSGRFYDCCKLTHKPCEKSRCVSAGGES